MKRLVFLALAISLVTIVSLTYSAGSFRNTVAAQEQERGQDQDRAQGQDQDRQRSPIDAEDNEPRPVRHRPNDGDANGNGELRVGFLTAGGTGSLSRISYHRGALIPTPTIYLIWYGNWNRGNNTDTPSGQAIVRDFAKSVSGSQYFFVNTTYSTNGFTITGAVTYGGEATVGYSHGTTLTDTTVRTVANDAISSGALPYNAWGVYFVITSSDVNESSGFCTQYCGWHTAGTPSAGHIRYAFIGNPASCINSCAAQTVGPNGNAGVDGMISIIAHELEEATTDPDPSSGWVDNRGAENADKCAWTFGSRQSTASNGAKYNVTLNGQNGAATRNYLIQRNLSATDNKCYIDWVNKFQ